MAEQMHCNDVINRQNPIMIVLHFRHVKASLYSTLHLTPIHHHPTNPTLTLTQYCPP